MVEVDIDKLLEKQEKQEAQRKQMEIMKKGLMFGGIGAAAAVIIIIIVIIMMGESSLAYFPLKDTGKYIYNRKKKSPESWQIQNKTVAIGENQCSVLNRIDQGNFFSIQEYYTAGKKGITKLAVSKDFGQKKQEIMKILPERLKVGATFDAGTVKNVPITGKITGRDEMSTAVGDCRVYMVEYRAGNNMNRDVWYGKGVGVIKYTDRVNGDQIDLVSRTDK